jgi:hypothetical protein
MNAGFVRRHLKCGKLRLRPTFRFRNAAWLGAPGSTWFVRSYWKRSIKSYRVEAQFNRESLVRHGIHNAADFEKCARILWRRMRFYKIDWPRLSAYFKRHARYPSPMMRRVRRASARNLGESLRLLRTFAVSNPDRFLVSLAVNEDVGIALEEWRKQWTKTTDRARLRS